MPTREPYQAMQPLPSVSPTNIPIGTVASECNMYPAVAITAAVIVVTVLLITLQIKKKQQAELMDDLNF